MDKQKFVTKVTEAGHEIDDYVEDAAAKHNYPKWKIWLGMAVLLALAGLAIMAIK